MTLSSPGVWILITVAIVVSAVAVYWLFRKNPSDGFNIALSKYKILKSVISSDNISSRDCLNAVIDTIRACQEAIRGDPNNGDAYVLLANTYLGMALKFNRTGIFDLGIRSSMAVMMFWQSTPQMHTRNKDQAETMIRMLSDIRGQMPVGAYNPKDKNRSAYEQVLHGDYLPAFEYAVNLRNLENIKREALARIELDEALDFLGSGHDEAALAKCASALEMCPDMAAVFFTRAQVKVARADYRGALEDIDTFEEMYGPNAMSDSTRTLIRQRLDPIDAIVYLERGLARYKQGDLAGAISDYDRAIALGLKATIVYLGRGLARYAQEDLAGAIDDYEQAIALDPKMAVAFHNRGLVRFDQGDLAGAISDYDQAIALDPKMADAYSNRALARKAQEDRARVISDYNQAIARNPHDAVAYFGRGFARYTQGNLVGAISDYDRAIALDPNRRSPYYGRGLARADQGDPAGAIDDLTRYLELAPNAAERADVEQLIANLQSAK